VKEGQFCFSPDDSNNFRVFEEVVRPVISKSQQQEKLAENNPFLSKKGEGKVGQYTFLFEGFWLKYPIFYIPKNKKGALRPSYVLDNGRVVYDSRLVREDWEDASKKIKAQLAPR